MASKTVYEPSYSNSWALVIGINQYQHVSPLGYACNDADKFADTLRNNFSFPNENVTVLKDKDATKENILSEFLNYTSSKVEANDRVVVFFAGHGFTQSGSRGEVGFLVPCDGDSKKLITLIRWDDLTRNSELVPAKHVLFIMDACYGGLAVQRYLPPGTMRFTKDMMQRFSRQVLTAGKADEVVADAGGPREGHSVFTGHLLDGLEGAAATADGLLTANSVMAYVYDRVSKDYQSNQTPHFGFLDGDGDMILDMSPLENLNVDDQTDKDILIEIPATLDPQIEESIQQPLVNLIKEYLSDTRFRIKLHDTISHEIRRTLTAIDERAFPIQGIPATNEEFANRLRRYEEAVAELTDAVVILARWGNREHQKTLEQVFARLPDTHSESGGLVLLLGMRWYPIMHLMYAGGVAALAAENYENLATILLTRVGKGHSGETTEPVIIPAVNGIIDIKRSEAFKHLPGHDRHYVPRSEYQFKVVQSCVEDLLYLGRDYERLFDRFEVLLALVYADQTFNERGRVWGPIGRFGWKHSSGRTSTQNPFEEIISEAGLRQENWGPLKAGLFNGSFKRFEEISNGYSKLLDDLNWF